MREEFLGLFWNGFDTKAMNLKPCTEKRLMQHSISIEINSDWLAQPGAGRHLCRDAHRARRPRGALRDGCGARAHRRLAAVRDRGLRRADARLWSVGSVSERTGAERVSRSRSVFRVQRATDLKTFWLDFLALALSLRQSEGTLDIF